MPHYLSAVLFLLFFFPHFIFTSASTPVTGTVKSSILKNWELEVRLKGAEDWTLLSSGDEAVSMPDLLGEFDTSRVLNGIYELRLSATDLLGRTARDQIDVIVEGDLKVGHFQLTFEDLSQSISGIPMQVLRTYDSRQGAGDFGNGWTMGLRNIRLYKNKDLSRNWTQNRTGLGFSAIYTLDSDDKKVVTIVFPDGTSYRFEASFFGSPRGFPPVPDNGQWLAPITSGQIVFTPIGDTQGELRAENPQVEVLGVTGSFDLISSDKRRFILTTNDGTEYLIDENDGLVSMTDRNGNVLLVSENEITTQIQEEQEDGSLLTTNYSLFINRDAQGRIEKIIDLGGNELLYTYDSENRLVSFQNRVGDVTTKIITQGIYCKMLDGGD